MTHKCPCCECEVPDERFELLGVLTCLKCTPQKERLFGIMEYTQKSGGVLMITDSRKEFEMLKRPANQRR